MTLRDFRSDEQECVEELRNRLKGELTPAMYEDTSLFIRFLRARDYDINASEHMLRNHINWRKNNKVDTILSWYKPHEVSEKYMTLGTVGFDKEASPFIYIHFGNLDCRGFVKSVKLSETLNFCIHRLESDIESMKVQSEKLKKTVDQWVIVFNFENLSLSTVTHRESLEAVAKLIAMYEGNYPERLKTAIFLNASWYFQIGFAFIKPLLSGPTFQKIKFFGKEGWKEELLKHIDPETLPAFLGGTRTDPDGDPMCRTIVKHGGLIPEHYYAINSKRNFSNEHGVKKLVIPRFSKMHAEIHVLYPGSHIEWEFETKGKDIAFSLLYRDSKYNNTEPKELTPKRRVDTTICPEDGLFKCDQTGTYILEFDNSYSWIHSKEVYYKTKVVTPHIQSNTE